MFLMTVLITGKIETIPQQGNGYDSRAPWTEDYYWALKYDVCKKKKVNDVRKYS